MKNKPPKSSKRAFVFRRTVRTVKMAEEHTLEAYMQRLSDDELDALDRYVFDDHDTWKLFSDLTHPIRSEFEPLEFYRLLEELVAFIQQNNESPLRVVKRFGKQRLSGKKRELLLSAIRRRFKNAGREYDICLAELTAWHYGAFSNRSQISHTRLWVDVRFEEITADLEAIDDLKERLVQAINEKAKVLLDSKVMELDREDLAGKLDIEINRIKELRALEMEELSHGEFDPRSRDLTLLKAIVILEEISDLFKKAGGTPKARLISLLTGFSQNSARQLLNKNNGKQPPNKAQTEALELAETWKKKLSNKK